MEHRTCRLALKLVLAAMLALVFGAPASAAERRHVLVLYSLGSDSASAWQRLLTKGIGLEFSGGVGVNVPEIFDERLDVIRLGEQTALDAMAPYLKAKYASLHIDAVVAENYHASRFLSEHPELFPGAARFYVNHGRPGWKPVDGAGLDIAFDFARAIGAIPDSMHGVRRVAVVADTSARGQQWIAGVRAVAPLFKGRLAIEYWDKLTFPEMYQRAAALGPDSAIYMFPTYADSQGERARPPVVARTLAARASVPVFTYVDSLIVPGVVGGYVISGERVGRTIGRIVLGKSADLKDAQAYMFDYNVARRFDLNPPADVVWLNVQPTVWDQYRWQIIGTVTLILLQAALITALVIALRERRRTMAALNQERDNLEANVEQRTRELQNANEALEQQVTTDALTGIGNRRKMTAQIGAEIDRARRFRHSLALLMIDIDNFKCVNDRFGHHTGDRAIVAVAAGLTIALRATDLAARFGGEEFVVLMPETDMTVALAAAERLRAGIAALRLVGDQGEPIRLTISVGVAALDPQGEPDTSSSLLSRADRALYRAKSAGRNRVETET